MGLDVGKKQDIATVRDRSRDWSKVLLLSLLIFSIGSLADKLFLKDVDVVSRILWLKIFLYGPLARVWRSLAYNNILPWRKWAIQIERSSCEEQTQRGGVFATSEDKS